MTDQKWVDFDYQRYLDGDEVFYRSGDKFEGEIFLSKKRDKYILISVPVAISGGDETIMSHFESGRTLDSNELSIYDLLMKPKTTKLWMAYMQSFLSPTEFATTNLYHTKEALMKRIDGSFFSGEKIIQVEIEV